MTINYSDAVRDAKNDAVETAIGVSPKLRIYTGSKPANAAAGRTGTLLVEIPLPSDWMANSSAGVKALTGTWPTTAATGTGTAGYYSIMNNAGSTCHEQGTVTATGGGGDMTVDNTSINSGQNVTITGFTKTDGNP